LLILLEAEWLAKRWTAPPPSSEKMTNTEYMTIWHHVKTLFRHTCFTRHWHTVFRMFPCRHQIPKHAYAFSIEYDSLCFFFLCLYYSAILVRNMIPCWVFSIADVGSLEVWNYLFLHYLVSFNRVSCSWYLRFLRRFWTRKSWSSTSGRAISPSCCRTSATSLTKSLQ
jgi:hypothetical protein